MYEAAAVVAAGDEMTHRYIIVPSRAQHLHRLATLRHEDCHVSVTHEHQQKQKMHTTCCVKGGHALMLERVIAPHIVCTALLRSACC